MSPAVSICIPCFNAERWISAAVQSALDQTWPEKEVIVVDDGSTDGSIAALEQFGEKIRVLAGEHRGGNSARNFAWKHSRGEWVQFLDADDYLDPEKIARQLEETGGGASADVIYSPVFVETFNPDGSHREVGPIDRSADLYGQWLAWQLSQTGGCLWRRSALEAVDGWKEGLPCCQEHELYLRAIQAGLRFVFAPTPGAVYRIWSEETLCRKDPRRVVRLKTQMIDEFRQWLEARNLWTESHQAIAARACFEMSRTIAKYDLAEATAYHRARAARGLIALQGPAAPASYRLAYRALGFSNAERLAAWRR